MGSVESIYPLAIPQKGWIERQHYSFAYILQIYQSSARFKEAKIPVHGRNSSVPLLVEFSHFDFHKGT